jgi:hypothetical protein
MIRSIIFTNLGKKKKEYPYLGIYETGLIVLFSSYKTGVAIKQGDGTNTIGTYSTSWDEDNFKLFDNRVELTNQFS